MPIKHKFTSPVSDNSDPDEVGPDEWNDDHEADDVMGVASHGSDANFTRPSGYTVVHWIGTVEPNNASAGDLWTDTS